MNNDKFFKRLNQKTIFVTFEDTTYRNEATDSAEAHYFDRVIRVSFPNSVYNNTDDCECFTTFELQLFKYSREGNYIDCNYVPFTVELTNINQTIQVINDYLKTRPFTIVKHGRGCHQLIDPNGYDYVGEYITFADARRTSCSNFKIG